MGKRRRKKRTQKSNSEAINFCLPLKRCNRSIFFFYTFYDVRVNQRWKIKINFSSTLETTREIIIFFCIFRKPDAIVREKTSKETCWKVEVINILCQLIIAAERWSWIDAKQVPCVQWFLSVDVCNDWASWKSP